MAKGISIHVGINNLDPSVFDIQLLPGLKGCENDAVEMFKIAKNRFKFDAREPLVGSNAKFERVVDAILDAAEELQEGGIFLFTFAGHGSQRPDQNHEEPDGKDEGMVLFDRILIDDFLRRNLWSQFNVGVRIVGVADCCHSGTNMFASLMAPTLGPDGLSPIPGPHNALTADIAVSASTTVATLAGRRGNFDRASRPRRKPGRRNGALVPASSVRSSTPVIAEANATIDWLLIKREISNHVRDEHFAALPDFYDKLKKSLLSGDAAKLKADLLTLSACQDSEETPDGKDNGPFTAALLKALNSESAPANYDELLKAIADNLKSLGLTAQTPVLNPEAPRPKFRTQRPFEINADL